MTKTTFDWQKLFFVSELANNFLGNVEKGKSLIDQCKYAVKFQYRDLSILHPTIITPAHKRFEETHMSEAQRFELVEHARSKDLIPIVTPFDELSVEMCVRQQIPVLKVASCSNDDWSLLEKIAETNLPVAASTGGLDWKGIDRLYYFLKHRSVDFSFLHCVAKYPSENPALGCIREMKERYAVNVGFSDHSGRISRPSEAILAGADFVEVHVCDKNVYQNDYSLFSDSLGTVISLMEAAKKNLNSEIQQEGEQNALNAYRRGNYATGLHLPRSEKPEESDTQKIRDIVHEYEAMFRRAKIPLNGEAELSHHYGIENLPQDGAYLLTVVNREYCKKLIAISGSHPEHYHKEKDETFQVLYGNITVHLSDGPGSEREDLLLFAGDIVHVPRGKYHSFNGWGIFEEISTHAEREDSYYTDPEIQKMDPMHRKTILEAE